MLILGNQIILGIHKPQTQAKSLDLCIDICKLSEIAAQQSCALRLKGVNRINVRLKQKTTKQRRLNLSKL